MEEYDVHWYKAREYNPADSSLLTEFDLNPFFAAFVFSSLGSHQGLQFEKCMCAPAPNVYAYSVWLHMEMEHPCQEFCSQEVFACVSLRGLCAFGVIARVNPAGSHTLSYNLYSCINAFF